MGGGDSSEMGSVMEGEGKHKLRTSTGADFRDKEESNIQHNAINLDSCAKGVTNETLIKIYP